MDPGWKKVICWINSFSIMLLTKQVNADFSLTVFGNGIRPNKVYNKRSEMRHFIKCKQIVVKMCKPN